MKIVKKSRQTACATDRQTDRQTDRLFGNRKATQWVFALVVALFFVFALNDQASAFFNLLLMKKRVAPVPTTLSLLAGNFGGSGLVDATGTSARFKTPQGVAVDSSGNIFVADTGNCVIRKITTGGVVTTFAGSGTCGAADGTGAAAQFNAPMSLAFDSSGNLFVADSLNHAIRKITTAGVVTTFAGSSSAPGTSDGTGTAANFQTPTGLAIDSTNVIYVADSTNHNIRKITSAQVVTTFAGSLATPGFVNATGTSAQFNSPMDLAVDASKNVYVADNMNCAIRKITTAGVVSTLAGGICGSFDATGAAAYFNYPTGIAITGTTLYVVDNQGSQIRKVITSTGVVTTFAGIAYWVGSTNGAGTSAQFRYPYDVAVNSSGALYVADTYNNGIRAISTGAVVSSFAGGIPGVGSTDGTGSAALFNPYYPPTAAYGPQGLAVDSSGNIYIADSVNHTIRKSTAAGVVTTLAGSAGLTGSTNGTGTAARFNLPTDLAVDSSGNIFVIDENNCLIRKITSVGVVSTLAGSTACGYADGSGAAALFSSPSGIAIDSSGNLFVADFGNNRIRKVTQAGVVTTFAGSGNNIGCDTTTCSPTKLVIDSSGNLYVTNSSRGLVNKVTAAGVVSLVAGDPAGFGGFNDGTGSAALFNQPKSIALKNNSELYVADNGNYRIRKIVISTGVVSTVVGGASANSMIGVVIPSGLPGDIDTPMGLSVSGSRLYISSPGGVIYASPLP